MRNISLFLFGSAVFIACGDKDTEEPVDTGITDDTAVEDTGETKTLKIPKILKIQKKPIPTTQMIQIQMIRIQMIRIQTIRMTQIQQSPIR